MITSSPTFRRTRLAGCILFGKCIRVEGGIGFSGGTINKVSTASRNMALFLSGRLRCEEDSEAERVDGIEIVDGVESDVALRPIDKPESSEREEDDIERRSRCRLLGGGVGPAGVLSNHRDVVIEPEKPSLMLRDELHMKALRIASLFLSASSGIIVMASTMRRAKTSNPQPSPSNDVEAPGS